MRDYERDAIADAAYDAWRNGQNYDSAWDRAERAIERGEPFDRFDAEEMAQRAVRRDRPQEQP